MEDEPFIAMEVDTDLTDAGFEVVTLRSCAEGEDFIKNTLPEVAILDINLLDGPCHDLARKLHQVGVPFIVYTGYPYPDYAGSVFDNGLWLAKPSDAGMLASATIRAMGTSSPISDGKT